MVIISAGLFCHIYSPKLKTRSEEKISVVDQWHLRLNIGIAKKPARPYNYVPKQYFHYAKIMLFLWPDCSLFMVFSKTEIKFKGSKNIYLLFLDGNY